MPCGGHGVEVFALQLLGYELPSSQLFTRGLQPALQALTWV